MSDYSAKAFWDAMRQRDARIAALEAEVARLREALQDDDT